jgi:hypothetical protein
VKSPIKGKGPSNIRKRRLTASSSTLGDTPFILARGTMAAYVGAATTTNTVNLPLSPNSTPWPANTLALVVGVSGPATFAIGAGWTTLLSPSTSSFLAYKFLDGSETTFTYTRGATFQADVLHVLIINNAQSGVAPEAVQATNDPASLSPSWGAFDKTIFLTLGTGAVAGTNITAYPAEQTDKSYSFYSVLGDSIGQSLLSTDARIYNELAEAGYTSSAYNPSTFTASNSLQTYTIAIKQPGVPTAQSLILAAGSFALSGSAATLKSGRFLPLTAGSFALSGSAANLIKGYKLAAATASFSLTGSTANFSLARKLVAVPGAFTITGSAATLKTGRSLALSAGSFALSGSSATLKVGRVLIGSPGSFALSGTAATLKTARLLALSAGSFTLSGSALTPIVNRKLALATGSFVINGSAATLTYTPGSAGPVNYSLALTAGSFALSGIAVSLPVGRKLPLSAGSFALTGTAESLIRGVKLPVSAGSFSVSGSAANFLLGRKLTLGAGSFALSGAAETLKVGRVLTASAGAFTLNGVSAGLVYTVGGSPIAYTIVASAGSFALSGSNVSFTNSSALKPGGGYYDEDGIGKRKKKLVIPHPDQVALPEALPQSPQKKRKNQNKAAFAALNSAPAASPLPTPIVLGIPQTVTEKFLGAWFDGSVKAEAAAEQTLLGMAQEAAESFSRNESLAEEALEQEALDLQAKREKEEEFLINYIWSTYLES